MNRYQIMVITLMLVIAGTGYAIRNRQARLCARLSCVSVPDKSSWRLAETYTDTGSLYRALYRNASGYLRIEARYEPRSGARQALGSDIARMKAMFEKAPAPYPGDISDSVVCDPEFVPTYREIRGNPDRYVFTGYLNDRLTFGSCSKSQAAYRGYMIFMYCPGSARMIRTEFIYGASDFDANAAAYVKVPAAVTCAP